MVVEGWEPVGVFVEGEPVVLDGVNLWDVAWTAAAGGSLRVSHPAYPNQLHLIQRYEVDGESRRVRFAAGELSANVWGVFVPRGSSAR